jgi:hypothetical protein
MKYDRIIFWTLAAVGLGIGAYNCYSGWMSVANQKVCFLKRRVSG